MAFLIAAILSGSNEASKSLDPSRLEDTNVDVINRTRSCEVMQAKRRNGQLVLSLRNGYTKRITAFSVSVGSSATSLFFYKEDFIFSEATGEVGIKPNETHVPTIALPLSLHHTPSPRVTIQAVVLDDSTGDGSPLVFKDIKDERLGEAIQMKRAIDALQKREEIGQLSAADVADFKRELTSAFDAPERETLAVLSAMRPTRSVNRDSGLLSDALKEGLSNAKKAIMRSLTEAENAPSPTERLIKMKAHYEESLRRL